MLVKTINESAIYDIGHAFGYYDYGQETGLPAAFSGQQATTEYNLRLCARDVAGRISAHHQRTW